MKKMFIAASHKIVFENVPDPNIRFENEVKIKVHYCAIFPDDIKYFQNISGQGDTRLGTLVGHGFSGTIVQVGKLAAAAGLSLGKPVTGLVWQNCGCCPFCKRGLPYLCINKDRSSSTYQEYLILPYDRVYVLSEEIPLNHGCLTESISICLTNLYRANISIGKTVLILGAGYLGQLLLQLVKLVGAKNISVYDTSAYNRYLAGLNHADYIIDPAKNSLVEMAMEITSYLGFDVIIDTSHHTKLLQDSTNYLSRGGTLLIFSAHNNGATLKLDLNRFYINDYRILAAEMSLFSMQEAMAVMPKMNLEEICKKQYDFTDIESAFLSVSDPYPCVIIKM